MSLAMIAKIAKEERAESYFQILPFPALAILAILARVISYFPFFSANNLSTTLYEQAFTSGSSEAGARRP
jgi:hypothetical protein